MPEDQKAEFNAAMRGPWLELPPWQELQRRAQPWQSRSSERGDPAYREYQYDLFQGGDPQYQPPQPQPYWNPEAPRARDHRYYAPI